MAHKLQRLAQSLKNTPHLVTRDALESYEEYLRGRNYEPELAIESLEDARDFYKEVSVENGVAVVPVDGGLTYRHDFIGALCGLQSHMSIYARIESAIGQGAKIVALDIDSPGGQAHGCFEYSEQARKLADENGVKILAYCDSLAASAGYAWASIADEIVMNPMGSVGSIGVVVSIKNDLPKDVKDGTEVIFVYSGDSKVPYDKEGKLKKEFIESLQDDVDSLYLDFVAHVAKYRPMTEEDVMGTQAKTFKASKALSLGLVDKVMTGFEFIDYLAEQAEQLEGQNMPLFRRDKPKERLSQSSDVTDEELTNEDIDSSELTQTKEGVETMSDIQMTQEQLEAKLAEAREAAKMEHEAEKQKLQEKLDAIESEKKAAKLSGIKEGLGKYSFIQEGQVETLASLLMDHEGSPVAETLSTILQSAQAAVEAGLDNELGDSGTEIEVDAAAAEKDALKKAQEARYANQSK